MNKITISKAIEGYLLAAQARRLSPHTIQDYGGTFRKFLAFLEEDTPVEAISSKQVEAFLASQDGVSNKTLLNYHVGLSALWTWCVEEGLVQEHIVRRVRSPKPEIKEVRPYTQTEVKEMLDALTHSKAYTRPLKKECRNSLRNGERHRAMIFLLLDTGVRAEELCGLRDFTTGGLEAGHGDSLNH